MARFIGTYPMHLNVLHHCCGTMRHLARAWFAQLLRDGFALTAEPGGPG